MNPKRSSLLAAAIAAAIHTPLVMAVDTGRQTDRKIEEIVVYGQKIPRTLQDTLASVSVIDARTIAELDLRSFGDAFRLSANVMKSDWVDSGFIIRGVNSEGLTPGGSPLATLYVDGAAQPVQAARRGARGLWDVGQMEIYRGPQSTMSGRASLAGAIYINTKNPTWQPDLALRATVGENDTRELSAAGGGALIDDVLAFRIAADYHTSESDLNYDDYERFDAHDDFVEDEYYQLRTKLLFEPQFLRGGRALLSYAFTHDSPTSDDIAGPALGFSYGERRGDLNGATPFYQENRESDTHSAALDVLVPVSDELSFTWLTTYTETEMDRSSINKGTANETDVTDGVVDESYLSQELRLNYSGEKVRWVAGLYGSVEQSDNAWTRTILAWARDDVSRASSDVKSLALFGELEYALTSQWAVIAGGRLARDEQKNDSFFSRDNPFVPGGPDRVTDPQGTDSDSTEFLPKLGLKYALSPTQTVGFTYATGYRSGGSGVNGAGVAYDYDAEHLDNYELAWRGQFWDGRAQLAANVYYGKWKDQQIEIQDDPLDFTTGRIENAARSTMYGAEVEAKVQLTDALHGFVSIGHSKTEFKSFDDNAIVDFSGLPFPQAPEWNASWGLDYRHGSGLFAGIDARYTDEYLARDYQNLPIDKLGRYTIWNLRTGYRADHWSLTLFADNAFDKEYFVYRDVIDGLGDVAATLGARRLVGATLQWQL